MGFDIFWQAFKDGEPVSYPRRLIEDAFGLEPSEDERDGILRKYPDGSALELYSLKEPEISGFMICRPSELLEFWDALFELMRKTTSMLIIPDNPAKFLVASPEILAHMPTDWVGGEFCVISSSADILAIIEGPEARAQEYVRQIVGDPTSRTDP